jgi:hypothetical protein
MRMSCWMDAAGGYRSLYIPWTDHSAVKVGKRSPGHLREIQGCILQCLVFLHAK